MFNKTKIAKTNIAKAKIAMCVALVLGGALSTALAANENDGGNETGGYVLPGSMDGVNPAYHPDIFGKSATKAFSLAAPSGQSARAHKKAPQH